MTGKCDKTNRHKDVQGEHWYTELSINRKPRLFYKCCLHEDEILHDISIIYTSWRIYVILQNCQWWKSMFFNLYNNAMMCLMMTVWQIENMIMCPINLIWYQLSYFKFLYYIVAEIYRYYKGEGESAYTSYSWWYKYWRADHYNCWNTVVYCQ